MCSWLKRSGQLEGQFREPQAANSRILLECLALLSATTYMCLVSASSWLPRGRSDPLRLDFRANLKLKQQCAYSRPTEMPAAPHLAEVTVSNQRMHRSRTLEMPNSGCRMSSKLPSKAMRQAFSWSMQPSFYQGDTQYACLHHREGSVVI